ncbi:MAG: 50S ribosomal protein L17 [Chloroflexi bacterium]|nr:50S ribosomal protein L17 [Chloroflexota bacterium]
MGGRKLGRPTDHRLALIRNQITDLLRYEKVRTTEAKARELRREAEKVITLGKTNDVHHRRLALTRVFDMKVVDKLFSDLGPRFMSRPGGYTRLIKLMPRKSDGAPMAQVEILK